MEDIKYYDVRKMAPYLGAEKNEFMMYMQDMDGNYTSWYYAYVFL